MSSTDGPLVLYVEDEPMIQELGVSTLHEAGFAVAACATGEEALSELDAKGADIRVLVTDIDLPGGMTGWEVATRARQAFSTLPVIYVSGGSADEWTAMGVPGSTMVVKPYAPAQLVVAVSTALQGAPIGIAPDGA